MFWLFSCHGSFISQVFSANHPGGGRTGYYLRKYIRPFAIYGLIGWLIKGIVKCVGEDCSVYAFLKYTLKAFVLHGSVHGNGALWFLLTLFFVRLAADYVLPKVHPLVVALVCMLIAAAHYCLADSHTPWYFGNFFSGLCFFSLGNYFRKHEQNKYVVIAAIVVFASFVVLYLTGIMEYSYFYFHKNTISKGNYLLFYPIALSGIIVTNNFFRKAYDYWKFPLFSYIGRNAMTFYVTHWIVLVVARFVFPQQLHIQSAKCLFLLYALSCAVCLPIINVIINSIKK